MAHDETKQSLLWLRGKWLLTIEVRHYRNEPPVKKVFSITGAPTATKRANKLYSKACCLDDAQRPYSFRSKITPPPGYGSSDDRRIHDQILNSSHDKRPNGAMPPILW